MFLNPTNRNDFSLKYNDLPLFLRIQVLQLIGGHAQRKHYQSLKPQIELVLQNLGFSLVLSDNPLTLFESIYTGQSHVNPTLWNISIVVNDFIEEHQLKEKLFNQTEIHSERLVMALILGWFAAEHFGVKAAAISAVLKNPDILGVNSFGDVLYDGYVLSNEVDDSIANHLFAFYSNPPEDHHSVNYIFSLLNSHEQITYYLKNLAHARSKDDLNVFHYFYKGYGHQIQTYFEETPTIPVRAALLGECTDRFISMLNYSSEEYIGTEDESEFYNDISGPAVLREACWESLMRELYADRSVPAIEQTGPDFFKLLGATEFNIKSISEYIRSKTIYSCSSENAQGCDPSELNEQEVEKDQARKALLALAGIKELNDVSQLKGVKIHNLLKSDFTGYSLEQEFIEKIGYAVYFIEKYLSKCNARFLRTDDLISATLSVEHLEKTFFIHPLLTKTETGYPILSQLYSLRMDGYLHFEIFIKDVSGFDEAQLYISDKLIEELF